MLDARLVRAAGPAYDIGVGLCSLLVRKLRLVPGTKGIACSVVRSPGSPRHGPDDRMSRRRLRTRMTANGKTVLLVEDNEDNRIVYSTILRHFGYSVTEALNGEEGIAKARSEHPDLILMDISIPVIDGWEATQVL